MTDRSTVQMVVVILGLLALGALGGMVALAYQGKPIPDALIGVSSGSMGAVAGLLAKTSSSPPAPPSV